MGFIKNKYKGVFNMSEKNVTIKQEVIGGCRLINGECLAIMDKLIIEGIKVDAIITDPPY